MNIAIIGTGVYGIAMATALAQNEKNNIKMWSESDESLNRIEKSRKNFKDLGGIKLPDKLVFSTSYEEVMRDADLVFIMVAAKYVSSVCENIKKYITKNMHFVIGSKGIEQKTCLFIDEIFQNNIATNKLGVISGPSFAIDIAFLEPIGLTLATKNKNTAKLVHEAYENTNIKLRDTNDIVGIEICGSIKNVIAIAAGVLDGLGYTESTRSFLITESLHDIKELIDNLGGNKKTILSFAGVGDLLLTATSEKSRNYTYGMLLGKRDMKKAAEYINTTTVEGFYTLNSIYALLRKKKVKMPVIDIIYDIVINNADPNILVDFLMKK